MQLRRTLYLATVASFVWNLALVVGVVLDASYAYRRAAGGQFSGFPLAVRITYVVITVVVTYQLRTFHRLFRGDRISPAWLPRAFFFLSLASVLVNAISPSSAERFNAIPAAVIAYAFWRLRPTA